MQEAVACIPRSREKGCLSKIYIDSGIDAKSGVSARLSQYDMGTHVAIYVKAALEYGYVIVHKGLLWLTFIPSTAEVPVLCTLFIALEAAFTFGFWFINCKTEYGYDLAHMCQWAHNTLKNDDFCSHNPFSELPAGDRSLSAEDLEREAAKKLRDEQNTSANGVRRLETTILKSLRPKPTGTRKHT